MRVVIKGNAEQAKEAATRAGVVVNEVIKAGTSDTILDVPDTEYSKVAKWFGEQPHLAPYPIGACLWYSTPSNRDLTPRYAPSTVMTAWHGLQPVTRAVFHPANTHPSSPIKNEVGALELITPYGSRWYDCDSAYINSELRMIVIGCNKRDEVRMSWQVCKQTA